MTRLQDRFDLAKEIPTPDLADKLRDRLDQDSPEEASRTHVGQRVLVGAVALVIFLVAGVFAWRAFRPGTAVTASGAPSDILQVQCDAKSVQVSTPVVAAQADGIHVLAETSGLGDTGEVQLQSISEPYETYLSGTGGVAGEFARDVPVGEALVWCSTQGNDTTPPPDAATFTIVDPQGLFVDYRPNCSNPETLGPSPIPDLSHAAAGTPDALVRDVVTGLEPTDVVEKAGYPVSAGPAHVRVSRDGSVIAFFITNQGLRFIDAGWLCPSSGLSYPTQGGQ